MSVKNYERLSSYIINWINLNLLKIGNSQALIGLSGGVNSSLLALFCKKINIPLIGIHIVFDEATANTVDYFASENNFQLIKIDGSDFVKQIELRSEAELDKKNFYIHKKYLINNIINGIISANAYAFNGSILSSYDKSKKEITKKIHKLSEYADLYPLADLYKSEILDIYKYTVGKLPNDKFSTTKSICQEILPEEDIGFIVTLEELEWALKENEKSKIYHQDGILELEDSPSKHLSRFWIGYNLRQREIIARLNRLQKNIKHQDSNLNVCQLRKLDGLVI